MSFRKLNVALLALFILFFMVVFSFHYRQTLADMKEILIIDMRKSVMDMKLDIKEILKHSNDLNIKSYLDRQTASSVVVDALFLTDETGRIIATSDDLYPKKYLKDIDVISMRQLSDRESRVDKIQWIEVRIPVFLEDGEHRYRLYIKIDRAYIQAIIKKRMWSHMFYPLLFFVGLALFYILYIKRMIIRPVMVIDSFLRGIIQKLPKFYIKEFNNLAKNLENNINTLRSFAYTDALTGLYNRKGVEELIEKQIKDDIYGNRTFVIALLDLDYFKKINDLYGHHTGDLLLQKITQTFQSVLKPKDKLGRLGGDEFLFIFDNASITDVSQRLTYILDRFKEHILIESKELYVSGSIGVVSYPQDGKDVETMMKHADFAMYEAKKSGRNQIAFFSKELGENIRKELELEKRIEKALQEKEFFLVYQPIVSLESRKIISAEALVRWNHPEKGIVYPSGFIETIEDGCCVKEFGVWVLHEVCRQQKRWEERGIDIRITMNLSVKHIMSPDFHETVDRIMQEEGVSKEKIGFEITEYTMMEYQETTVNVLRTMQKEGYHFILDDFGTGYSSITYLKKMPIEMVKIDKSFIDEITVENENVQILDAIIDLTQTLELQNVAEGVEEAHQLTYLQQKGCQFAQGYYFSKPLEVEHFEAYYHQVNGK